MSGDPGIDVVVPARDAAATLPACLDGLEAAGFAPYDIVVCDDGSRDGTAAIAAARGVGLVRTDGRGAAVARNAGVAAGAAPVILFVDADVVAHADMRARIADFFATHADHAGVIGSYDDAPPAPGRLSRIRNLLHHHVHQNGGGDVPSFWTGCGAIRRADFVAAGGFEPGHPLEDVALGLALARAGRKVRLAPAIQCTHLKRWTLRSMIRADLLARALPWSRMLLDPRNAAVPAALNAGMAGKLAVALAGLAAAALPALFLAPATAAAAAALALGGLVALHSGFLRLVSRRLGRAAVPQAMGVIWVHHLCAGTGFAIALGERIASAAMSRTGAVRRT